MKFSAMSRNAKPTANPTTPASPTIDSTACVRFNTDNATMIPAISSAEPISEPSTDRNSTFVTNGASSVSEYVLNVLASSENPRITPSAKSASNQRRETTSQIP